MTELRSRIYLLYRMENDPLYGACEKEVLCVTTSKKKLKKAVEYAIHKGTLTYAHPGDSDRKSKPDQIRQFREDWRVLSFQRLNRNLTNGSLQARGNGIVEMPGRAVAEATCAAFIKRGGNENESITVF